MILSLKSVGESNHELLAGEFGGAENHFVTNNGKVRRRSNEIGGR